MILTSMILGLLIVCAVVGAFGFAIAVQLWTLPQNGLVLSLVDTQTLVMGTNACNRTVICQLNPNSVEGTTTTLRLPNCPNGSTMTVTIASTSLTSNTQVAFEQPDGMNPVPQIIGGGSITIGPPVIATPPGPGNAGAILNQVGSEWTGFFVPPPA